MKKFLLILLAILLAFSIIACDDENRDNQNPTTSPSGEQTEDKDPNDNVNEDENNTTGSSQNGNDDGGDEEVPGDNEKPGLQETTGIILTNAVMSQLEEAASLKLEITLDLAINANVWKEMDDGTYENLEQDASGIAYLVLTVAKSDNGYDVKVDSQVKSKLSADSDYTTVFDGTIYYVVDGVVYEYAKAFDAYLISYAESIDTEELQAMLAMIIEEIGLTEEQINEALNAIGTMFIEAFQISNNKGSSFVDFKPYANAMLSYLQGIDPETKTIRNVLDDILSLAGEGVTVDVLLQGAEALYQMTLEEFIAYLDAGMQEASGMTLQEAYEYVVNDENVQMLLLSLVYEMVGEDATEEDINAMLDMIMSFNIANDIPAEFKSMTMYEIMVGLMYSGNDTEEEVVPPTMEETMAMVNAMLDTTLAELEEQFALPITLIIDFANSIEINELSSKLDLSFKGIFEIESIISENKFSITVTMPAGIENENDVITLGLTATFKLSSISTTVIKIDEPTDKDYIENIFDVECQIFDEDATVEVTYDDYGAITVTIKGGETEETYQITLDNIIDGNTIVIGDNMIVLYPEMEYAEILSPDDICEHVYGPWQEDEWGDIYRVCVACGEYEFKY